MKMTFLFLFFIQFSVFSQCDTADVIKFPEVDAQFPGGVVEMKKFILENVEYPPIAQYECFTYLGPFYVKFIVCDEGTVQNIQLMRPSDSEYAKLAIELVEKMPNWIPAEQNGVKVSSVVRLPISFILH